jgi:regulator of sigma D
MNKTAVKTRAKTGHAPAAKHHPERRMGSHEMVRKLMDERTEMLVLYCRLAGVDTAKNGRRHAPTAELLQEFCQVMVDYLAAGHFSLYERTVNGNERRQNLAVLAEQIYPKIADTTQAALDFNDKYDGKNGLELSMAFDDDLSRLGEVLASRIETEDKLLKLVC